MVRISVLSPVTTITKNNNKISFPLKKCRSLFTYLLLNRNNLCTRNKLAYTFWCDFTEDRARKNLSHSIWLLNKIFKDNNIDINIVSKSPCSLEIDKNIIIDIDLFYNILRQEKKEIRIENKIELLNKCLTLGCNYLLSEEDELWLEAKKINFSNIYKETAHKLSNIYKSKREYKKAITVINSILEKDPLDEIFNYQKVLLLYISNQGKNALESYQNYCNLLKKEMALNPGMEFILLHKKILRDRETLSKNTTESKDKIVEFLQHIPFVGRTKQTKQYKNLLTSTIEKSKISCLVIEGAAGTGKTRFIEEILSLSSIYGTKIISLKCSKLNNPPSFSLASLLIEQLIKTLPEEKISHLPQPYIKLLSWFVPDLCNNPSFFLPGINKQKDGINYLLLFKSIDYLVKLSTRENPLIISIDDIQWADKESLDLLNYLMNELKNSSLLILNSLNTDKTPKYLDKYISIINELSGSIQLLRFNLKPLSNVQICNLLKEILVLTKYKTNIPVNNIVSRIKEETAGIPLYIVEILRNWQQKGLISFSASSKTWLLQEPFFLHSAKINIPDIIDIPKRLEEIYDFRISHMSDDLLRICELAAIVGFHFDKKVFFNIMNKTEEEAVHIIDKLISYGILIEKINDNKLQFSHRKLREYIYDRMSNIKKEFYHRKIFNYYLSNIDSFTRQSEITTYLAWHAYKADIPEAARYSLLAGNLLLKEGYIFKGIYYLNKALDIYKKHNIEDLSILKKIYLVRGKTYFLMAEVKKAENDLNKALDLSEKNNDKQSEGELYSLLAQINTRIGNYEKALYYIKKVIAIDNILDDIQVIVENLSTMSQVSLMTNNIELSRVVCEELEKNIKKIPFTRDNYNLGRAY